MSVQLNFTLRTSANCKTVHLLGTWDNYTGQLPLSKDTSKSGGWKGSFRFQGKTLKPGQRYWYYYIIDGYHVSHDPARESVVEPTTRRRLNVLDIPTSKSAPAQAAPAPATTSTRSGRSGHARRPSSAYVAQGRSLSPSKIESPRPTKPHATRQITTESFSRVAVDELTRKFASMPRPGSSSSVDSDEDDSDSDFSEDNASDVPSLNSSRSSNSSSPTSSVSSASSCSCQRYGITRAGSRVKLDCGGSRCGGGSDCESEEDERARFARRRHGVLVH